MKAKHTSQTGDMDVAFASILETANDETADLAGERYSNEKPDEGQFSRWGSNPGSVAVGGLRVRVDSKHAGASATRDAGSDAWSRNKAIRRDC